MPTTSRGIIVMTSSTTTMNVYILYFEHKDLYRISGGPTFATLHHILLQLNTNEGSIPSELGGCAHGYIGNHDTFPPPNHHGVLTVALGATQLTISLTQT